MSSRLVVLDASVVERWLGAFQNIDDMSIDLGVLDRPGDVGNLGAVLSVEGRPDNLLRIAYDRKVRVVRNHDDLPAPLGLGQDRDEDADNGFVVWLFADFSGIQAYVLGPPAPTDACLGHASRGKPQWWRRPVGMWTSRPPHLWERAGDSRGDLATCP